MQNVHVNSASEAIEVIEQHMKTPVAKGFYMATVGLAIEVRCDANQQICSMHMCKDAVWQPETRIATEALCGKGKRLDQEFAAYSGVPQVILY